MNIVKIKGGSMLELIVSKDYREYIERNKIELSEWDRATLIYNHINLAHDEKLNALTELHRNSKDLDLKEQLAERVARDTMYYRSSRKITEMHFMYWQQKKTNNIRKRIPISHLMGHMKMV